MKKFLFVLTILLLCSGCSRSEEDIHFTYDIVSKDVDMSGYEGVNSTQHMFKRVTVQELFNCIDKGSSAPFYLGRTNCGCCQTCVKYLNQVASELGVTVYYIDVYDPDMPLTDQDLCDELRVYIYDILENDEDGEKALQTPTMFSVINGNVSKANSIVCLSNYGWDDPPTKAQEDRLMSKYKNILKPFVDQSQD